MKSTFSRAEILDLLSEVNARLAAGKIRGEICIFGGAAMVLAWNAREATRDVDAIFAPAGKIRKIVREIAEEKDIPESWLNDGVKGFLSPKARKEVGAAFHSMSHLEVYIPEPRYLLAMKAMAARIEENQMDTVDFKFLVAKLGLKNAEEVLTILEDYYPLGQILPRTIFFVRSIFE